MIVSFGNKATEDFFPGIANASARRIPHDIHKALRRKLDALNAAQVLGDLAAMPGNKLEALKKELKGKHSIRINDQWRITFVWTAMGPSRVEWTDYHGGVGLTRRGIP